MVKHYHAMSPRGRLLAKFGIIAVVLLVFIVIITIVAASPTIFSENTPLAGSTILENKPTVSISIYNDGSLDMGTAAMLLDGVQVGAQLTGEYPDFVLSYTPSDALADGLHTVAVGIMDINSELFETDWSFTVGVGPVLSNISPAPGSNLSITNPQITFTVNDFDKIDASSVQVTVNGQSFPVMVEFLELGEWVADACASNPAVWVSEGYDYSQATITATTVNLPDVCNVRVSVADRLGNITTKEWIFTCMVAPVISHVTPANNTGVNTAYPLISAKVTDNGVIDEQSIILRINSTAVNHTFDMATGLVSYVSEIPMSEGIHNVSLDVKDLAGNKRTANWKFTVGYNTTGPVIDNITPAEGAILSIANPTISFTASDSDTINAPSVQIQVNGKSYPAQVKFREIGHWEEYIDTCISDEPIRVWKVDGYDYTYATITATTVNLPDYCEVWVSVADHLNNVTVKEWNFECKLAPVFSNLLPSNGSNVNTAMPTISAKITDNGVIDQESIILRINTKEVNHSFNPSTGVISYIIPEPLPSGNYTVYLEAKDTAGNKGSVSWNFNVPVGTAAFSGMTPSPGSDLAIASPQISVNVNGTVNLNKNTLIMVINGIKVNATISFEQTGYWEEQIDTCTEQTVLVWVMTGYDYKKGTITFKPAALPDGINKVAVSIADINGKPSSLMWSFQVKIPPVINNASPVNNATVAVQTPTISARVTDNGTISNVIMKINNEVVSPVFNTATGIVSYTPSVPLENGKDYTINVTATDAVGAFSSLTWKFHIQIYPDMPVSNQCSTCHEGYPVPNHPVDNCYGCHGNNQPIEDCADCHGGYTHGPEVLIVAYGHGGTWYPKCTDCHKPEFSYKIPMHATDNAAYHNTTTTFDTCESCHELSLTREHNRYKDDAGNNYTCFTCHQNTNPDVKLAIENKQKNCEACHGAATHETVHQTSNLNANCANCHLSSLTMEHLNNPVTQTQTLTCDSCHQNNKKEIRRTIAAKSVSCAGCHKQGHSVRFVESVPGDIPLYPGFSWTTPLEVDLFKDETGTPAGYETGLMVLSSRRKNITAEEIWGFYLDSLTSQGWTPVTLPEPGSVVSTAEFISRDRSLTLKYYNTLRNTGTGAEVGYRIEIWYK